MDFTGTTDITDESYGYVYQYDLEGNYTVVYWFIPDPYFNVYHLDNQIFGNKWTPNTTVTLNIGTNTWTAQSDSGGRFGLYLDPFDILPGQTLVMTDGTYTKTHTVKPVSVTGYDLIADDIFGTASANEELDVIVYSYFNSAIDTLVADGSGSWTADFSGLFDLQSGTSVYIRQYDEDGDFTAIDMSILQESRLFLPLILK